MTELDYSMPICCRCNASGRCKNCSCKKSGKPCEDCLPSRQGRCENGRSSPEAIDLTDWENPSTATTYSSSTLSQEEGSEQGSELPNTFRFDENLHTLPSYPQIHEPSFTWGNVDGVTFTHAITCCYNEVVHWKRNVFKVPSGKVGNSFVKELTMGGSRGGGGLLGLQPPQTISNATMHRLPHACAIEPTYRLRYQ